ncbi:MAG: hypothetical protein D6788_03415, partial [Planctomycetota bacterium]
RKLSTSCPKCRTQNHLRAKYCNECGAKLPPATIPADANGREKAHRDVAHPTTAPFRHKIQTAVLEAYRRACEEAGPEVAYGLGESEASEQPAEQPVGETMEESISDYDAIIADLKQGGRSSGQGERSRGEQREDAGGRGGRHRRRRRDRGRRGGERKERPAQPAAEPSSGGVDTITEERPPREEPERYATEDTEESSGFGAGLEPTSSPAPSSTPAEPAEPSPPPQRKEEESPAPPPPDPFDDDAPFGAGLL